MENSASELLAFSRDYLLPLSTRRASSLPSPEWDSPQNQPHLRTVSSDHLRQFWKQTPRWVSVQENRGHTCEGRWAGNRWKLRDIGLCWSPDAWEGEKRRGCLGVSPFRRAEIACEGSPASPKTGPPRSSSGTRSAGPRCGRAAVSHLRGTSTAAAKRLGLCLLELWSQRNKGVACSA